MGVFDTNIAELKSFLILDIPEENKKEINKMIKQLEESNKVIEDMSIEPYSDKDYFKIDVKFKNESNNSDPEYAKDGDSGFDLRANLTESITLSPMERKLIPTGLYFELPLGYELQVRPRSGLALKNGITVLNSPGTVDTGYRGEIKVILINLSNDVFTINHGDRIAQAVIATRAGTEFSRLIRVEELSNSDRGEKGFGSTGHK